MLAGGSADGLTSAAFRAQVWPAGFYVACQHKAITPLQQDCLDHFLVLLPGIVLPEMSQDKRSAAGSEPGQA